MVILTVSVFCFFCRFHFECEFIARLLRWCTESRYNLAIVSLLLAREPLDESTFCVNCFSLLLLFLFISSLNTPPGTKVKLLGTVHIKNGLLLLDDSKISVLGGVVEHMVEKWELQRVSFRFCVGWLTHFNEDTERLELLFWLIQSVIVLVLFLYVLLYLSSHWATSSFPAESGQTQSEQHWSRGWTPSLRAIWSGEVNRSDLTERAAPGCC